MTAECLRGMDRDRHIYLGAVGAPALRTDEHMLLQAQNQRCKDTTRQLL